MDKDSIDAANSRWVSLQLAHKACMHSGIATTRTSHGDTSLLLKDQSQMRPMHGRGLADLRIQVSDSRNSSTSATASSSFRMLFASDNRRIRGLVAGSKTNAHAKLRRLNHSVHRRCTVYAASGCGSTAEGDRAGCKRNKSQLLHHPYPEYDFLYPGEHRSEHWVDSSS